MRLNYRTALWPIAMLACSTSSAFAIGGAPPPQWRAAVDSVVVPSIAAVLAEPIVEYAVLAQNTRYDGLEQSEIDALDDKWRSEHDLAEQPLISAILSNPVSSYLTRVQAQAIGLYTEIFVMDDHGLNVGQSNISSDFWQGDEPEFREDIGVWVVQVNVAIDKDGEPIGASTFEINLTELARRSALGTI